MSKRKSSGARSRARELLVQALYQKQITGHDLRELRVQFHGRPEYERVDKEYFDEALSAICSDTDAIESALDEYADRPLTQLDPVEKSILYLGYHELNNVIEVPYRVVINEAVNLARRFGAEDGHKYINALLDKASVKLRTAEHA
jgi:N utilization substance protein B